MNQFEVPAGFNDLGILIPTWDRPEEVRLRLDEIAGQFGKGQRVHVQVNPGQYGLDDLCLSQMTPEITGAENDANVGFIANIMYGITHLSEEWVWILGDDDSLSPECAVAISKAIPLASESTIAIVFNQWSRKLIPHYRCTDGVELLENSLFGDLLFISATVWRRSYFMENMIQFVDLSHSCASQVALLLQGLEAENKEVLRFSSPLIDYRQVHRWSRLALVQRMAKILILDVSKPCKASLAYSLFPQWLWATQSSYQEVCEGSVKWSVWFSSSITTLIQIHYHNPWILARQLRETTHLHAFRERSKLRTQVAQSKLLIRNALAGFRRGD